MIILVELAPRLTSRVAVPDELAPLRYGLFTPKRLHTSLLEIIGSRKGIKRKPCQTNPLTEE